MFGISASAKSDVLEAQATSALGQAAHPPTEETKAAIKKFLSRLRVSPKEKMECSICWE